MAAKATTTVNMDAIVRQVLLAQREILQAQGAGQATAPGAAGQLTPQMVAAIAAIIHSSMAAPVVDNNPNSDANRRQNLAFKIGKRPKGTAGRGEFNFQRLLALDDDNYNLFLRTGKRICVACNFDMDAAAGLQDSDKLICARSKASSQAFQRWQVKLKEKAEAEARAASPNSSSDQGGGADKGKNKGMDQVDEGTYDEGEHAGDLTTTLVLELDGLDAVKDMDNEDKDGEDSEDDEGNKGNVDKSSSDEEVPDGTPFLSAPPAYNPDPALAALVNTPAITRKARKLAPALALAPVAATAPNKSCAHSLAPAAVPPSSPVPTANSPAPPPTRARRSKRTGGAVLSPVSIAPTSTVAVSTTVGAPATTTLSYAATTHTTVQAQASSTTGTPIELANPSHFAWVPASERPRVLPAPNPVDPPPTSAAPKKGKKVAPATPPAETVVPKPSGRAKPKPRMKAPEPIPDPEPTESSEAESIVPEPAPVKSTRKKKDAADAKDTAKLDKPKPTRGKGAKAKVVDSAVADSEVAPKAKSKPKKK